MKNAMEEYLYVGMHVQIIRELFGYIRLDKLE